MILRVSRNAATNLPGERQIMISYTDARTERKVNTMSSTQMEEKFRKIQMQTVGLFTILIVGISLYLTILLSGQSDNILKQTSAHLVAAHNHQMEMNINSYLTNVEKAASLLFGDEEYYTYDPNDSPLDPYEKQQVVTAMEDRINDFGILDNYTDFSVVYNNGDSIGWISKLTRSMYVNTAMYDDFADILGGTDHRWVFGLNGNTDHLYYLKRYNSQTIIMVSFYSLGTITDGTVLPRNLLVTSNTCENGWRIVCSMPTANITRQTRNESRISLLCVLVIIALILWFGLRRANAMNLSAAGIVETLQTRAEHDSMTGLYNKTEFEQEATSRLASPWAADFKQLHKRTSR